MLQGGMLPGTVADAFVEPGRVPRLLAGFPALRHRNFRLFVVGQGISLVGFWMQSVAQGWLVYRLEGRPLDLAKVAFAGYLPILCLAPFAGVVADRLPRRPVLLVTQSLLGLLALVLGVLVWTGAVTVPLVVLCGGGGRRARRGAVLPPERRELRRGPGGARAHAASAERAPAAGTGARRGFPRRAALRVGRARAAQPAPPARRRVRPRRPVQPADAGVREDGAPHQRVRLRAPPHGGRRRRDRRRAPAGGAPLLPRAAPPPPPPRPRHLRARRARPRGEPPARARARLPDARGLRHGALPRHHEHAPPAGGRGRLPRADDGAPHRDVPRHAAPRQPRPGRARA